MFLVAPPDHPLASKGDISPRDLEEHAFIGFEEGTETRMVVDALFRRLQLRIEYLMESSNVATIKRMVLAGLGVGDPPRDGGGEGNPQRCARPSVGTEFVSVPGDHALLQNGTVP